jgi:hypothetical protein
MHSPWVSRALGELGHEVIVAHARNVRLMGESRKKDDRLDAQTLARLARIDPKLLCPVKHRSARAQADLTVIRARAGLVRARTALYLPRSECVGDLIAAPYCGGAAGVVVAPGVIWVPITSPDTIISTRRFSLRPAAVPLSATGFPFPNPRAITLLIETPLFTK